MKKYFSAIANKQYTRGQAMGISILLFIVLMTIFYIISPKGI